MNEENNITGDRLTNIPTVFREDVEQDVSMTVQVQLDKAGITEHKIADVLDTATAVMRPVESEEDLRALQDVLTPIVRLRTNIVRICKKGREHANMVSKAWIAAEKLHVAEVSKVEAKLDAYKQEWKEAQERAKAEEEAEAKRIINERFAALEGLGMVRRVATADKPERYEVGDVSVSIDTIETCDLARWEDVVARATAAAQELRRQADERAQAEQAAREALEKRERDLAAREARANKVLDGERAAELDALGAVALERPADPLHQYDDEQWAEEVRQVRVLIERRKQEVSDNVPTEHTAEPVSMSHAQSDEDRWREWVKDIHRTEPVMHTRMADEAVRGVIEYIKDMTPKAGEWAGPVKRQVNTTR